MVPHQDNNFDNPAALCLALSAKNRTRLYELGHGGGIGYVNFHPNNGTLKQSEKNTKQPAHGQKVTDTRSQITNHSPIRCSRDVSRNG